MTEALTNKLLHNIKRSGLIEEDRLKSFLIKAATDQGGALPDDPQELSALFVAEGLITEWQAKKLLAGKHRGFLLGKYKLQGEVGKGGMSAVYLAEHLLMRRQVAIKVLPKSRVKDASYLERFRLEARAVAKLDDPHIVRAFDIDNEGDVHYIVMEYIEGPDLHRLVTDNGPLDADTAADYTAQAAIGLAHAHEKNLVHRDIKPANLLVDKSETVKLLDLGLARLVEEDEASLTLANDENVLGTADYLAPEQALNSHTADYRSDIYSLGCTLYFLLTGRPPFPEGTISERLLKHQVEEPESLFKLRPEIPFSLVEICNKMMNKRPDLRYESAMEVSLKLSDWLADRGRKVKGARLHESDDEHGIGSGILTRFAMPAPPGSGVKTSPSSETISNANPECDTSRLNKPSSSVIVDEDISLAPIDDDQAPEVAKSSGVLSGISSKPKKVASSTSDLGPPTQSLFEEEMLAKEANQIKPRHSAEFDYNPLHPPGYTSPYQSAPWALIAVGAALVVGMLAVAIAMSM